MAKKKTDPDDIFEGAPMGPPTLEPALQALLVEARTMDTDLGDVVEGLVGYYKLVKLALRVFVEDEEFFAIIATGTKNMVFALQQEGFTRDEAMLLVTRMIASAKPKATPTQKR